MSEYQDNLPDGCVLGPKNEFGMAEYFLVPTEKGTHVFSAKLYRIFGWDGSTARVPCMWDEVGVISQKWDGCCHLGFRDPELGKEWVHVCGEGSFKTTLELLKWAWDYAKTQIPAWNEREAG